MTRKKAKGGEGVDKGERLPCLAQKTTHHTLLRVEKQGEVGEG